MYIVQYSYIGEDDVKLYDSSQLTVLYLTREFTLYLRESRQDDVLGIIFSYFDLPTRMRIASTCT